MVEVSNALRVFIKEFRFSRYRLSSFDKVEDSDGCSISLEKIVKMSSSSGVERIHDADYKLKFGEINQEKK